MLSHGPPKQALCFHLFVVISLHAYSSTHRLPLHLMAYDPIYPSPYTPFSLTLLAVAYDPTFVILEACLHKVSSGYFGGFKWAPHWVVLTPTNLLYFKVGSCPL